MSNLTVINPSREQAEQITKYLACVFPDLKVEHSAKKTDKEPLYITDGNSFCLYHLHDDGQIESVASIKPERFQYEMPMPPITSYAKDGMINGYPVWTGTAGKLTPYKEGEIYHRST